MTYFWKWLRAALIRAIKTYAQTAVGMITVGAAMSEVNWAMAASVSAVAAICSLLMSIAGLPEVEDSEPTVPTIGDKDDDDGK